MKITEIKERFQTRKINQAYVDFLASDFKENGFKNAYPVSITTDGVLWDGNHRVEAAIKAGLTDVPHIIEDPETMRFEAHERNRVSANALPETFVDRAEEIWQMLKGGKTQQQVADDIGWTRAAVSHYSALENIFSWNLIATEFQKVVATNSDGIVAQNATGVAITENLLRNITDGLSMEQQHHLVRDLIAGKLTKAEFKKNAINHKTQNSINEYVEELLKGLDKDSISRCLKTAENGMYSREWKENKKAGEKLNSLVQSFIDEWEKKHCFNLFNGDFTTIMPEEIEADSLDYIITDPPYPKEYISLYEDIAKEAARSLKPGGSLIVMAGQSYIPEIMSLMCKHLSYQWILAHLTPGGQSVQLFQRKVNTFFKPLLWFVKGDYKGKWIGDVTKSKTNDNDKRFHEWGQSESGMLDIIKRFTEPGDMICDPFLGGGTIGIVALSENRKFVGIEKDKDVFNTAKERIERSLNE